MENLNKKNKIKNEEFKLKNLTDKERAMENLRFSNNKNELRQLNIINSLQRKDSNVLENKKMIEEERKREKEEKAQKLIIKIEHINKLQRLDYLRRQQKYKNYLDRESKRGRVKTGKNDIIKSKSTKFKMLNKQRQENIAKIQKILKSYNDENLLKLVKEFPDNNDILENVKNYITKKKELENEINRNLRNNQNVKKDKNIILSKSSNYNNTNRYIIIKEKDQIEAKDKKENSNDSEQKKKIENEIKAKIKKYKDMRYKEFWEKVEKEKKNETLRSQQLSIVDDEEIKNNLENQFSKERSIVDRRLKNEHEEIKRDIEEFETFIRSKYY